MSGGAPPYPSRATYQPNNAPNAPNAQNTSNAPPSRATPSAPPPPEGEVNLKLTLPQTVQKIQLPKIYPYVPLINNQYVQNTASDKVPTNTRDGSNYGSIGVIAPNAQYNMQPWMAVPNPSLLPNVYNIKIGNLGDPQMHQQMYHIYEETLPHSSRGYTLNSLEERTTLYTYLRSVFVRNGDGEDVGFSGNAKGRNHKINLLSLLKILQFHPYFFNRGKKNPYRNIADRMIVYQCGFPLRLGTERDFTKIVNVAKNNIQLNMRIYELMVAEEGIGQFNALNGSDFDVWRELTFYEYVRNEILRKKQSPNFVMLYCYYVSSELKINFQKLRELKYATHKRSEAVEDVAPLSKEITQRLSGGDKSMDAIKKEFNTRSAKSLVLLTESPTTNIVKWATRIYDDKIHNKRLLSNGFYNDAVWKSIIFQIIHVFYVLIEHGIAFTECSLFDNIYIKSIQQQNTTPTGYWIYNVRGVQYFVQNYGYLVMFDSNFRELDKKLFKVYSSHLYRDKVPAETIQKMNLLSLSNCLNPDNFSSDFVSGGGVRPSNDILHLLQSIYSDIRSEKISSLDYILITYFRDFLHNRIGTLASEEEVRFKKEGDELKSGEMVLVEMQNKHVWALLLSFDDRECSVLSTQNDHVAENIVTFTVPRERVRGINGVVAQRYVANQRRMSEEERIEMYMM